MKVTICFKGLLGTGIKRETKTHIRRSFYSLDIMTTPKGYIMSIKDKIKINPTHRNYFKTQNIFFFQGTCLPHPLYTINWIPWLGSLFSKHWRPHCPQALTSRRAPGRGRSKQLHTHIHTLKVDWQTPHWKLLGVLQAQVPWSDTSIMAKKIF